MKIRNNIDLSKILWYKIGPVVRVFIEVCNKEDIFDAFTYIQKNKISKFIVIGSGTNILFGGEYFDGAVIKISGDATSIKKADSNKVEAFSGELLDNVIKFSFENNLTGFEWAGGLPGTIGAAVRGNVGAFGSEIKDIFDGAEAIKVNDKKNSIVFLDKGDMNFSYRDSLIKKDKNLILISVKFNLLPADKNQVEKAKEIYKKNIEYRKNRHPLEFPNCGSVFKNITKKEDIEKVLKIFPDIREKIEKRWHGKISAGYLIGRLGFCGYKIGQAQLSEKHNNFIINLGGAKFSDVKGIIDQVQQKFQDTFGFIPETEIEIIT